MRQEDKRSDLARTNIKGKLALAQARVGIMLEGDWAPHWVINSTSWQRVSGACGTASYRGRFSR